MVVLAPDRMDRDQYSIAAYRARSNRSQRLFAFLRADAPVSPASPIIHDRTRGGRHERSCSLFGRRRRWLNGRPLRPAQRGALHR